MARKVVSSETLNLASKKKRDCDDWIRYCEHIEAELNRLKQKYAELLQNFRIECDKNIPF